MSLLTESYEPFVMLDKSRQEDGYGGYISTYAEGVEFPATATFESSIQARIGAVQGVTALYNILTPRSVNLQYHEVCKRIRDGKIFRVTSDGDDNRTPASATLDIRKVEAEEWSLANG